MNQSQKTPMAAIILAAGQGTRMGSAEKHKVCFPVAGVPSINRLVGSLREQGCDAIVVVVGALAGDVVRTVGDAYPETLFVLQRRQNGTGDATRVGFAPLERMRFAGLVLVTMGDKVIAPHVFGELVDEFHRSSCDALFAVTAKPSPDQGRVAVDDQGRVRWLLEQADVDRARVIARVRSALEGKRSIARAALRQLVAETIPHQRKAAKILGPLGELMAGDGSVPAADVRALAPEAATVIDTPAGPVTGDQAARDGTYVNESLYLFRSEALAEGVARLTARTAQGELYLPDVVTHLLRSRDGDGRPRWKVRALPLADPDDILGYNTPDQLLAVEATVTARERKAEVSARSGRPRIDPSACRPVAQWLKAFQDNGPALRRALRRIYGDDDELLAERVAAYQKVLRLFARRYGAQREAIIARAPGRVNLMGRHVEHRGGYINPMAINREVLMVASPREDDTVRLVNVDARAFPDHEFSIGAELAAVPWDDWLGYITSRRVQQMVLDARGDWSNYVKAACLRLQGSFRHVRVNGMDVAVLGDIPQAAGLSSSSAIVVAAGEATIACNRLDVTASDFVDLCGEGEWYVGSRGGAGDHAAMKFGRRSQVSRIRFFPFAFEYTPGIPDDYRLVVFNSLIEAKKSAGARDIFNQKVAAYEFAQMLILDRYPHLAHLIEHLRDINPERLHVRPHVIYEMLASLPPTMTREQLRQELSAAHRDKAERIFQTHSEPTAYDIRSVMLYGLAECARSERCGELLKTGQLEEFGRMMCVSHDGDRVTRRDASGKMVVHDYGISDAALRALAADLQSEQPERVLRAQIYNQPGGYACSVPEIDHMVDVAMTVEGVLGAQLSGAGLGGCMMVLVRADAVERLKRKIARESYRPRGLKPAVTVCRPIEGSGLLRL
jgi:N-acetylgalactosamine kinase